LSGPEKTEPAPVPCFRWALGDGTETTFRLSAPEVSIGRKSESDIVVPSINVSKRQARVVAGPGGYELIDTESRFGTFVNGKRVKSHVLRDGDRITFGKYDLEFRFLLDSPTRSPLDETTQVIENSVGQLSRVLPSAGSDLEKMLCVLDFQYQWEQIFTPESGLEQILRSAVKISGAERGFIMTREDGEFRYRAGLSGRGRWLPESEFATSRSVVGEVAAGGRPVFMAGGIDSRYQNQDSIMALNLRAIACLPLRGIPTDGDKPEILGILYLDSTHRMHSLSGLDEKILNKLALEAGNVLERVEMVKGIEQRRVLERDLALAEETQRSLLPQELPALDYLRLHAFSRPTRYVGGDFYHFNVTESNELVAVLADVSGKGIAASLLSSMMLGCLQLLFGSGRSPSEAINDLNTFFCKKPARQFATMFVMASRPDGTGEYISAGHNPAYVYRAKSGTVDELESTGLILGAFDFASFEAQPLRLDPGDVLLAYSDGLTDAEAPSGEMFGELRVKELVADRARQGGGHLHEAILNSIQEFTGGRVQTDDITLVIAERI
jgi:phosphoserine phosphatase RsbU/P